MEIAFIRHGEPDYTPVEERGYIGHGVDLAPLTPAGREQARRAAEDERLEGVELILSSPYTRALQTAAIISRIRNVDLEVLVDLHEWMPDLTFGYSTGEFSRRAGALCDENKGVCPPDSAIRYEELSAVFRRADRCLREYLGHRKIAVVTHGIVISQFDPVPHIPYCGIRTVEYTGEFQWKGYVEDLEGGE